MGIINKKNNKNLTKGLLVLGAIFFPIFSWAAIERVPFDDIGIEANGNIFRGSISLNNQFVAFYSAASNLVSGDANGYSDVFLVNRTNNTIKNISVSNTGVQGNNLSEKPSISSDGRFVAFRSMASNLVSGDTNNTGDVFIYDRNLDSLQRVTNASGVQANGNLAAPNISSDGRFVVFVSSASNLVAGDTNSYNDIFVYDREANSVERVSVSSAGAQSNNISQNGAPSSDGRFIVFKSTATNLVSGDTNAYSDIFLHDRVTHTTEKISMSSTGAGTNQDSFEPDISADGRFVVFQSRASNLVSGDTNNTGDIFVYDRTTQITERISISNTGVQGNQSSITPGISTDGRFVVFQSLSTNLVSGDTNGVYDVFLYDRETDVIERISVSNNGIQGTGLSELASLSDNGRLAIFQSYASNLVPGDTNGFADIFVYKRAIVSYIMDLSNTTGSYRNDIPLNTHSFDDGRKSLINVDETHQIVLNFTNNLGRSTIQGQDYVDTPFHFKSRVASGIADGGIDTKTLKFKMFMIQ